jgi:hypothetical protein
MRILFVTIAVLAVAACAGNGATLAVPSSATPINESKLRGGLVYISDSIGNFVDVFNVDGSRVARITDGLNYPVDLFVDAKHNLYVANDGSGTVLRFKRGAMNASATYKNVADAFAPALCANGKLYVANGSIVVFARGHHKPTGTLTDPYGDTLSVSCDAGNNLFATATVLSPPGYVVEYPAGSSTAKLLPINLANPVDAVPDPAGNLLVLDSAGGSSDTVGEYTEAGSPTGKSMPTNGNWNQIAIAHGGHELFGANESGLDGVLAKFPSGKIVQTYTDASFAQIGGIAFDPGN